MAAVENALVNIPESAGLFLFLSEVLNRHVLTSEGSSLGRLADLKVKLGEPYPRVTSLAVRKRGEKGLRELDWDLVHSLDTAAVRLEAGAEVPCRPLEVGADEVLLRDELLDKQVVDTMGARIERVNDVHLLIVNRDLRVVHVDFGARGILRRLGWLRLTDKLTRWLFAYQTEDRLISWKYVQPLLSGAGKKNLKLNVSARKLHELHPSDLADIIEELDRVNRSTLFRSLDLQTAAQTLEEVEDPKLQASLIDSGSEDRASDILEEMAPDEATDLLADLPRERKEKLIQTMEKPSRDALVALLRFKEGTAGSIMTKDFFAVRTETTIREAIEEFARTTYPLESVAYVYVTDRDGRLAGVSTLRQLLVCDKEAVFSQIMNSRLVSVEPEDDIEEVAELFEKYKFLAIPVVDKDRKLDGIITLKDIMQWRSDD